VGFVVAFGGLFTYEFFGQFPITRDFPWANLLLFSIGATLLLVGLFRAFWRPQVYRGKIFGSIFAAPDRKTTTLQGRLSFTLMRMARFSG
jgi:hypothetical protein